MKIGSKYLNLADSSKISRQQFKRGQSTTNRVKSIHSILLFHYNLYLQNDKLLAVINIEGSNQNDCEPSIRAKLDF